MKKSDIIKRITDIVSDNPNKRIDLIQFNIEPESYKCVLYKTERGSIHILSYPMQHTHPIRDLSAYVLSNILYEIGNEDDMKAVKKDVNPTVYALCLNRLNKSVQYMEFYSTATGDLNEIARQYNDNVTTTDNVKVTYNQA